MKRYVFILITLIILIVLGLVFVNFENNADTKQVNEVKNEIENIIVNEIESEVENIIVEDKVSEEYLNYPEFSNEVIMNLNSNEVINVVDTVENLDGTITLILRKYIESETPTLTDEEYNILMENKEIELLDQKFVLVDENLLTNHNYISFEFDENKKLIPYMVSIFYKGTEEYYKVNVNSDFMVDILPDNSSTTILEYDNSYKFKDLDYLCSSTSTEYIFDENAVLIKIEMTW